MIDTIIAAWQDGCDLVLLTRQNGPIRFLCCDRSHVADRMNRRVKINTYLGLVFDL